MAWNLLTDPIIRVVLKDGSRTASSLPAVFAALACGEVAGFVALRPHQKYVWHMLLVQLAALALHRAALTAIPTEPSEWRALLQRLTPDFPADEPWSLVSKAGSPAFLQAPCREAKEIDAWREISTPDALDMLATAKNHDVKAGRIADAAPDDWLFALVSLQTQEGYMGAGNFGISRMNGGFSSRPCVGIVPPGGPSARFLRDLRQILDRRQEMLQRRPGLMAKDGIGLVWLISWSGDTSIRFEELDPFYIEICRRVRLTCTGKMIQARATTSKQARISAKELKGHTGDPWTPIAREEAKALSITERGFHYALMAELLFDPRFEPAIMQEVSIHDPDEGLAVVAAGIARGQGKTAGWHERVVPLSKSVGQRFRARATDVMARMASDRVADCGTMRARILRPALFKLIQEGRESLNFRDSGDAAEAGRFLDRFEAEIDRIFFDALWGAVDKELSAPDARREWRQQIAEVGESCLRRAIAETPHPAMRRWRAASAAQSLFRALLLKNFPELSLVRLREQVDELA